jgi:hypothetical protein
MVAVVAVSAHSSPELERIGETAVGIGRSAVAAAITPP